MRYLFLFIQIVLCHFFIAAQDSNVIIKSNGFQLEGSLRIAKGKTPSPVVLIISGSGPTDRNCNQKSLESNAFLFLADSLESKGISSLRYDKRGVGSSTSIPIAEHDMKMSDFAADARACIEFLSADKRFSSLIVLGHSEGSLLGILASEKNKKVKGFISIAGSGRAIDDVLKEQLDYLPAKNKSEIFAMIDKLKKGDTIADVPDMYKALFRPSVQPFLISYMKYDPLKELKKLKVPVLILQGTADLQVKEKDALLLSKANKNVRLKLIADMTHVLKQCINCSRSENIKSYNSPNVPIMSELVFEIQKFFLSL